MGEMIALLCGFGGGGERSWRMKEEEADEQPARSCGCPSALYRLLNARLLLFLLISLLGLLSLLGRLRRSLHLRRRLLFGGLHL